MEFPPMNDSNIFTESHYINLKYKSPSPSPFKENGFSNNDHNFTIQDESTSPTKSNELKDGLELSVKELSQQVQTQHSRTIAKMDIYKRLLSQTAGKDKIAKTLQYLLSLIKFYLTSTRRFIVDEKFDNLSLSPLEHYKTPIKYLKLLLFLNSTMFEKKITEITKNISIFRFMLRFGGTPYRVKTILSKFQALSKAPSLEHFQRIFLNEASLADFINFYYGVMDELFLLYKINVLSHPKLRKFVGRHIDLAWFYDIIFGLKQNWSALSANKNKQMQIDIQFQVRQKASQLSKRFMENIGSSPLRSQILKEFNNKSPLGEVSAQSLLEKELKELKHQERILKMDIFRLMCDLVQVSIDVWDLNLHPVIYIMSGLTSGATGLTKVWANTVKEMKEE